MGEMDASDVPRWVDAPWLTEGLPPVLLGLLGLGLLVPAFAVLRVAVVWGRSWRLVHRSRVESEVRGRLFPYLAGREGLELAAVELIDEFGYTPVVRVLRGTRSQFEGHGMSRISETLDAVGETELQARRARSWLPFVRNAALAALGDCGGAVSVVALRQALSHRDPGMRQGARDALLRVGGEAEAAQTLGSFLQEEDVDSDVALTFVRRLAGRHPGAVVARLADPSLSAPLRKQLLEALGRAEAPEACRVLRSSLRSPEPEVRAAAARIAGSQRHWPSRPRLLELLDDHAWFVQAAAASALAEIPALDAVEPLVEKLEAPHWWVRRNAALGLTRHGQRGLSALLRALQEPGVAAEAARLALFDQMGKAGPAPVSGGVGEERWA